MRRDLQNRIQALEGKLRLDEVVFELADGSRAGIPRRELVDALVDVTTGIESRRASIMLRAVSATNGSRLHEFAQAFAAGPVPPGQVNE